MKRLHPYQINTVRRILSTGVCGVCADPGMGKTATALAAFQALRNWGRVTKALVVAPLRVARLVWPLEVKEWDMFRDITVSVLHGPKKESRLSDDSVLHVINPEGLKWLFTNENCPKYEMIIVDESAKFKNWTSQRTEVLKLYIRNYPYRILLAGNPTPRSLEDIFAQQYLLDGGKSFSNKKSHFIKEYFYPSFSGGYELKETSSERIYNALAPYWVRLSAKDLLNMPDLKENDIFVELSKADMKIYRDMERRLFSVLEDAEVDAVNKGVAYQKCSQIAAGYVTKNEGERHDRTSTPFRVHKEKITALVDLVEELDGSPLLIGYMGNEELVMIREALGNVPAINGSTTAKEDMRTLELWNAGKIPVLCGQPQAMGHGLNMQKVGRHVCWFSFPLDWDLYDQLNRRVYRQGVSGSVIVHRIIAKGTIDHVNLMRLKRKETRQNELKDAIERLGTSGLSTALVDNGIKQLQDDVNAYRKEYGL